MPQEHLTTVLTALFASGELVTPQTNPIVVYGAVFALLLAVGIALWASRPLSRGLGQKPLTPRPDDEYGLPWMPGGEIFGDEPAEATHEPARAAPTSQPPTYQPAPTYQTAPTYEQPPTYPPEPAYRPQAGAPQFSDPVPRSAPPETRPAAPRNPWSTGQ